MRIFMMYGRRDCSTSTTTTIPSLVDSYPIESTIFEPPSSSPSTICVVISGATGNRRKFYFPFAHYLSQQHNMRVVTYDYRGTNERQRTEWTILEHWARRDCAGVLSHCFQKHNQVVHVGHSLGGNLHALLPPSINKQLTRILLVSAASSYLMYHKWNARFPVTLALLYLLREPMHLVYGYYPMRTLLRSGADFPTSVLRQWARWSRHKECFIDDKGHPITDGFESLKCPIVALNFADDEFYTRRAFDSFTDRFRQSSDVQKWHLPKGGHFNFFKQKDSSPLWQQTARFLKHGDSKNSL